MFELQKQKELWRITRKNIEINKGITQQQQQQYIGENLG
jgi:hypothetical protein